MPNDVPTLGPKNNYPHDPRLTTALLVDLSGSSDRDLHYRGIRLETIAFSRYEIN